LIVTYFLSIFFIVKNFRKTRREKREAEYEKDHRPTSLDKLLAKDTSKMNMKQLEELEEKINSTHEPHSSFNTSFKKQPRLDEIKKRKEKIYYSPEEIAKRQIRLLEIEAEKREERQRDLKIYEKERKEKEVLDRLETDENYVYKKDDLSNRQIETLKKEGYKFANEYCVFEKKRINVMIRPPSNHLIQHTFLVWSITKLLEQNKKIKCIEKHLSVNADITFTYDKEEYAIEVETGSLLRKSEQRKEKVGYLNRKFPKRWLFVVSNKEIASGYAKFGPTATRNSMARKLEKLLKKT